MSVPTNTEEALKLIEAGDFREVKRQDYPHQYIRDTFKCIRVFAYGEK